MDMTHSFWEENANIQRVKYESCNSNDESRIKDDRGLYTCCDTNLNFSTATCSEDDCEYGYNKKNKVARQDPMSHRIIEKRRRDRMNNCLADLSRLIPTDYLKKGRGRIEKTEIIEMAIKHMKYLQEQEQHAGNPTDNYRLGYQECMSEAMRFMVEVEGHFPREAICVRLLAHLQKHCETITRSPNSVVVPQQPQLNESMPINQHDRLIRSSLPTLQVATDYHHHRQAKSETEPNNNIAENLSENFERQPEHVNELDYEKHPDTNGVSYKYKNSIKMRFNKDINATSVHDMKRQKLDNGRRNSVTSIENQSSSYSSPPSSELCTRISDSETTNRQSPSDSGLSVNLSSNLKVENGGQRCEFSPIIKNAVQSDLKHNFNVPIFALHPKGSYYIPLTIDYKTLLPFLHNYDLLEGVPAVHSVVLHPVTINVNFQPNNFVNGKYKTEFGNNNNNWH